ncbi:hypothetical protein SEVIR_5G306600v4 [Setaria viridis]|uniref:Uncharacterized protein n=2 Tax=Setaria TaxID=4554 RepID=A0A368RAD8_SETIT|nr:uncharacterized protein LOC101753132 [Setaria italica]XP_034597485.1 uncharacterized protein LOC117858520 [Setaria viridis]RCV27177.1 hypothetical protein SETIT_5G303700v2 [Setaria italica]TKW16558.1 hypothetical protein SEVIR_5G306600v2 [Setaria viridis]
MANAEEFCESEVLWPEAPHDAGDAPPSCSSSPAPPRRSGTPARGGAPDGTPRRSGSRPVDIPRPARSAALRSGGDDDDEDGGRNGTMVPPHVLVSRRRPEGGAAFALRSGPGRARELSHLRNSVLRMTGFIEG